MEIKKIKEEIVSYLDGVYTSNRYWVMYNRRMSDQKFQDILNMIEKDFIKFIEDKLTK